MRLRLDVLVRSTAATVIDQSVLFGAIRWNMTQTANSPLPFSDAGADWLAYGRLFPAGQGENGMQFTIDVRSMRKLEELQQTIILAFEAPTLETGTTVTGTASSLLALP